MMGIHEIKEKGYLPQRMYLMLMLGGSFTLFKTLILNLSDLKKIRRLCPGEKPYVRPPRHYSLPLYRDDMQVCESSEKYLRPTLYCDPQTPEVIAMAHELGAFKKTDYEYAEAAFWFVKRNLTLEILPLDGVGKTLQRGTGTCFHLISTFIALCRAAGIKARYKMFAMNLLEAWYDAVVDVDPIVKKWYDSMGYFMIEGEGEVLVDGKWQVAHVGPTPERQAAAGIPITRFGEDSIGIWFFPVEGTLMRMESIPFGLGSATRFLRLIAPGSMARINNSIQEQIKKGKQILSAAGGEECYDKQMRKKQGPEMPIVKLREKKEKIIFLEQ